MKSFKPPKSPFHSFIPARTPIWNKKPVVPLDKLKTVPKRKAPVSDELAETRKKKKNVYAPIIGIPYQPDTPPRMTSTTSWVQSSIAEMEKKENKETITQPYAGNWWEIGLTGEGEFERRNRAKKNHQKEEQSSKNNQSNNFTNASRKIVVEDVAKPPKQYHLDFEKPKPKSKKQFLSSPQTPPRQSLIFDKPGPKSKKKIPTSPPTPPPKQYLSFEKPGPKSKKQIPTSSPRQATKQVHQPSSSHVHRLAPTKSYIFHFPDGSSVQKRKIAS